MNKEDFIQAGFSVVGTDNNENKLLCFLKENYPSIIKDNEIDLNELKVIAGLPIDEKVNGYGLNFVGRNFARGKYAQKTTKELKINTSMSKNIDTTQNLVLKGDNLDCLKILKNYYSGQIKCIYIDPPYNTVSDEFVYPDKFDKEETEVLGLANLSDDDFARMDFSFRTKKSHNGWLSFMYPRLLLARDLLSDGGVIFISIDDNEQANLKLLCDDIFGEENFVNLICWKGRGGRQDSRYFATIHEYILCYAKNINVFIAGEDLKSGDVFPKFDKKNKRFYKTQLLRKWGSNSKREDRPNLYYSIKDPDGNDFFPKIRVKNKVSRAHQIEKIDGCWRWAPATMNQAIKDGRIEFQKTEDGEWIAYEKIFAPAEDELATKKYITWIDNIGNGAIDIKSLFENTPFDYAKPVELVKQFLKMGNVQEDSDIILDFFAGSGTTGQAVMQLNAEDGGNRKFILCQIDEPIKKDKPAYKFCKDNNLPTVISSITIERLKRAGEKIAKEIEIQNAQPYLFGKDIKQVPDIGFKVFDSVEAPKLKLDGNGQISIIFNDNDTLSRIYNMIFTVGLDEPTQVPEEVVKDCIYKIGNHYYITNSEKIKKDDFAYAIKNGKVFIDGWTASLNGTLQNYKEDVKIVF